MVSFFCKRLNEVLSDESASFNLFWSGGDKRDRTADLLNAIQALSQLSYTPIFSKKDGGPKWTRTIDLTIISRVL